VPVRKSETAGREGRWPDGSAKTREAKPAVVWSGSADRDGRSLRDPGPAIHNTAIESSAGRDAEPASFAWCALREVERRGFDKAARRAVLGDGAAWIWNFADEHFPDAVQIVDVFHPKQHLFDAAKAIHGPGTDLAGACEEAHKDAECFSANRK